MSLFAGSECSTSKNPLSQFSGHSLNADNSLHRQQQQQQQQQLNNASITQERLMNAQDSQQFSQFANGQTNKAAQSSFNMQPIHRELANINNLRQVSSRNLSSRSMTPPNVTKQIGNGNWSQEFSQPNAQLDVTNQGSSSLVHTSSLSYQPRFMNNLRFANMRMQNGMVNPDMASSKQEAAINWDTHFKDIENEMASKEKFETVSKEESQTSDATDEVIEEISGELKHNIDQTANLNDFEKTFEEIWGGLNQKDLENDLFDNDGYAYNNTSFAESGSAFTNVLLGFDKYQFVDSELNQFRALPNPYEIGVQLMESGAKLSEAALAFEAAVQQDPNHIDAWLRLGEVQSANEKEKPGIIAYNQVLKLDPSNLTALMNSAIGYINEGYDSSAALNLQNWIFNKYPQSKEMHELVLKSKDGTSSLDLDYMSRFEVLADIFMKVIQTDSTALADPQLQLGLGVLFYACGDFDKTVDCFSTALKIEPNNDVLWNRLGAAYANSNRPEDAIAAYYKALQLRPSFVRARYNLGIACINIGCYKEAAQHLLAGLSLHKIDDGIQNYKDGNMFDISANQSNSLLETLKRAFISMERKDLVDKVKPDMDLNQFRNEFEF